jgi:hypothetical protein
MLPPKFRVLGRDLPVVWVSAEEMPKAWGEYDYETQVVRVREGQQPAFEADTVLHELIHAIDDAMQLGMTERQVHCSATGLIALFKDNPIFLEYLSHAIRTN